MRLFDSALYLGIAIAMTVAAILATWLWATRRRQRITRLGGSGLIGRLAPATLGQGLFWRGVRLSLATALAAAAFAGPRWGQERTVVRGEGIDMVLALDASLSMLATDERPSRLERLKAEVRRLRAMSPGDRVALLAFAGRSYILTPLTLDDGALELYLDNLEPSVVGQAGSSLAATIRQGTELLLASKTGSDRALVVMSDGEAFEEVPDIQEAARKARDEGISLVTVGFGTVRGSTIPVTDERGRRSEKRDENGVVVISRYNAQTLRAAAEAASGSFVDAAETDKASRIRSALAGLRRQARAVASGDLLTPRFQLFLLPAVLLLLLDTWLAERRSRPRISRVAVPRAAAVAVLLLVPSHLHADDATDGIKAYKAGRYSQAALFFRRALDGGDKRPETLYNYGTALLALDSLSVATEVLDRASHLGSPDLRYRALFNLGLAHLRRGLATEGDTAEQSLSSALETYKKVLIMRSKDADAKWNYELALRKKKSGGGGGGGGQSQSPSSSSSGRSPAPEQQPAGGLGQRQAEQLLKSAAREERDVQGKRLKHNRPEMPPGGKDW